MKIRIAGTLLLAAGAMTLGACGGGGDSSSSTSSGGGSSSADVSTFCDQVDVLKSLGSTFQSLSPGDLEGAKTAFQEATDGLQKADDVAPAEIKSDMDAVLSTFQKLNSGIQNASSASDLLQIGKDLQPEVKSLQEHSSNLKAYAQDHCGSS